MQLAMRTRRMLLHMEDNVYLGSCFLLFYRILIEVILLGIAFNAKSSLSIGFATLLLLLLILLHAH